jgi:hypothetical protein
MTNVTLKYLFARRAQHGRWIYILAALPVLLFALWEWDYGAFLPYLSFLGLLLVQYFYPTIFVWLIVFFLYLAGSLTYLYLYFRDLFEIIRDTNSGTSGLAGRYDLIISTLSLALIVAIAFGLYKRRPTTLRYITTRSRRT